MAANPGSISSQPAAAALTGAEVLPLDQAVGSPVAATALTIGTGYRIVSLGNTNWAAAGAGATPAVGTVFSCTAVGTGTGTAQQVETRRATAQEIAARALQDPTAAPIFAGLTVSGTTTAAQVDADLLTGPVSEHCRNVSGVPLAALTPLYVTGSQGDTTILEVVPARGDTPSLMPAAGLALAAMGTSGSAAGGHVVVAGPIAGVNTAGLVHGQELFVAPTGGVTPTQPTTGEVQVVATVGRVHANTGTVVVNPGPALALPAYTGAYSDISGRPGEISQAEAEEGTGTGFRVWSAQRVRQAVAAWWAASVFKAKLDGIASGATANSSDAVLLARANHTGTQTASTITGLAAVATSGSYSDLSGRFDPATPGAIGGGTAAAGSFTSLSASSSLLVPSAAAGSPVAGQIYRVTDQLRYRDSSNAEQGVLYSGGNLANLASAATARANLGLTPTATATPAGGLSIQSGNLTREEDIKLNVSNKGETVTAATNHVETTASAVRRACTIVAVAWELAPSAPGSSSSQAMLYARRSGTKTSLLSANASLAASAILTDATSLLTGTLTLAAGDTLGVDLVSVGTGSSGHILTVTVRYS